VNRDQLKAEFRKLVMNARRAIDEGFEPGIGRMLDGMADAADRYAAEARGIPDMPALRGERNDAPPDLDFTPLGASPEALAASAARAEQPKPAPRRATTRRSTGK
jgi:hypothetical protein